MSNLTGSEPGPFQVKSPFRLPWYKDRSYLTLSILSVATIAFVTWVTVYRDMYGKGSYTTVVMHHIFGSSHLNTNLGTANDDVVSLRAI